MKESFLSLFRSKPETDQPESSNRQRKAKPYNDDRSDDRSGNRSDDRSDDRSGNRSDDRSDDRSGNRSDDRSGNRSGNRSDDRSDDRSGNRSGNRFDNRSSNRSDNRSNNRSDNRSGNQSDNRPDNRIDDEFQKEILRRIRLFIESSQEVQELEPMNSYHRRVVHHLAHLANIESLSLGEGRERWIKWIKTPDSQLPSTELEPMTQNNRFRNNRSDNRSDGRSDGRPDYRSDNRSDGRSDNRSDGRSDNRSDNRSDYRSDNRPDGRSDNRSDGRSDNRSDGRPPRRFSSDRGGGGGGSGGKRGYSSDRPRSQSYDSSVLEKQVIPVSCGKDGIELVLKKDGSINIYQPGDEPYVVCRRLVTEPQIKIRDNRILQPSDSDW